MNVSFGNSNDNDPSSQKRRLDAEWLSLSAIREIMGLAFQKQEPPTYRNSLGIGEELFPLLFHRDRSLLFRKQESADAKLYRQMADKRSKLENKNITAINLLDEEVNKYEQMLMVDNGQNAEHIEEELRHFRKIRKELDGTKKKYEENDIILRDIDVGANLPISYKGEGYREFELPDNRVMRIRLFHPSKADRITGADVVYEHYANSQRQVRIAAIQYKIWDGVTLYKTPKIGSQIEKLRNAFCRNQCCEACTDQVNTYRLPCCSAFLRPTDELQDANAQLISSGYHIPICKVGSLWENTQRTGQKLIWTKFRSECITYRVFEELFNTDMLGSRWLDIRELEEMYKQHNIFAFNENIDDRLLMHVQAYRG